MKYVTYSEAIFIVQNGRPHGLYYTRNGENYIGIDASTNHVWTKEFDSFEDCLKWLRRE